MNNFEYFDFIDNFSNESGNQLIAILSMLNYLAILLEENKL